MTNLGIAVGSTSVYAARPTGTDAEVIPLSAGGSAMAVAVASIDGRLVVGDEAARRPRECVRDVVRRLGDPTPIAIGPELHGAAELTGLILEQVVARASAPGDVADRLVVAHPAAWSGFRVDALHDALERAGRPDAHLVAAPLALVLGGVIAEPPGAPFAVLHLGGVSVEATIVTVDGDGARVLGQPVSSMHTAGDDLDRELVAQVRAGRPGGPVPDDLLDAVRTAKEGLASVESATVPLGPHDAVTLARSTLSDLVVARVDGWWSLVARAARSAGCAPSDLGGVRLVGGSARLPGLADALAACAGVAVTVVGDPESAVARGAARLALPLAAPSGPVPVRDITALVRPGPPHGAPPAPPASGRRRRRTRRGIVAAVIAVLVAAVGGATLVTRITSGDDTVEDSSGSDLTTTPPPTTVVAPATSPATTSVPPTTALPGTDPVTYASDVCGALATFASDADAVVRQFDQDPSLAGDDLGPIRDALVDLTTRLHASAVTLLDAVVAPGPPAIIEGDQFHRELIDAVTRVRDGLAGFATRASQIDVADPAIFAATLNEIALGYDEARADADAALGDTGLRHPDVAEVLRSQPACEGVFG